MHSETYQGMIIRGPEELHMTVYLYARIIGQYAI